ncbi:holo-ACP synthase [Corynebacterium anserum]|uniref:holo-ACP synthase AcpS n=1 Tax=Corynebacterium anserum TaxID=2684406 RepID=UPI001FE8F70D|nr:holo-ACP synthase [Corynebacterium anserum]
MIVGLGTDLVEIAGFAEQLHTPGTAFSEVFTSAERRAAQRKAAQSGCVEQHLAARWSVKESFIKAWSAALFGRENPVSAEKLRWQDIEVVADQWGRPSLILHEPLASIVQRSIAEVLGERFPSLVTARRGAPSCVQWHVSMSHDGAYATATVIAEVSGK